MLLPKRVKHRRVQRGRLKGKATRGNKIAYGDFGLVALEPAWITSNQIEAARIAMTRYIKRGGQVWIKIFPDKPITEKPAETRMGSGKGSPEYWVAVVKPGRVMFEMDGVAEDVAKTAAADLEAATALLKDLIAEKADTTTLDAAAAELQGEIDALVDRRAVRHLVHKQELKDAHAKDRFGLDFYFPKRNFGILLDDIVKGDLAFEHAVHQSRHKGAVHAAELVFEDSVVEREVGIGAVLFDFEQNAKRDRTWIRHTITLIFSGWRAAADGAAA